MAVMSQSQRLKTTPNQQTLNTLYYGFDGAWCWRGLSKVCI